MQMYAIARFSNWLHSRQINLQLMDEGTIQQFLKRDLDSHSGESAPLRRLLAMLREIGITAAKPVQVKDCIEQLTSEYEHYLLHERGLAQSSLLNYVPFAEQFLTYRFDRAEMTIASLTAKDVTKFIQDRVRQMSPGRAKLLVTALRSFLRYLRHQDRIAVDLAGCVPSVACWSLSTVPKFLPAGTVQRVLSQCERETVDGKRNYAVLLMLARLGLRACEIVALTLDDIDWDDGLLTIRCKGGRWAQLPMPTDIGEAIAIYVHSGRPRTPCRRVFLRHRAPIRGFAHSITVPRLFGGH
jgi:site-specific recombinase XerD